MVFKKKMRRVYRSFGGRSRRSKSGGSSGMTPTNILLAGAIYGFARPMAAKYLPDMFQVGPVDSDNVIIGAAGWYGMKKGKGLVKALGTVALASEAGIVAARLSNSVINNNTTNTSEATNVYDY